MNYEYFNFFVRKLSQMDKKAIYGMKANKMKQNKFSNQWIVLQ